MLRLIALNPAIRKRILLKKAHKRPKKVRHIMKTLVSLVDKFEKPSTRSQPQESMRPLKGKDRLRALNLIRHVIHVPDLPSNITMRLLKICIHLRSPYVIRQVLDKQKVNLQTLEGGMLLLDAVIGNQEEIATMLKHRGADFSDRKSDSDSRSLLHAVLRSHRFKTASKREELVRLILDCGADVNACDDSGYSLLHDAIIYEHCSFKVVEELLQRGEKLTINESCSDLNDIYLAADYKTELLPRLIEHQVSNDETRERRKIMAIDYLLSKEHDVNKTIDTIHMVEKILDLGGPVNVTKSDRNFERCDKSEKDKELQRMKEEMIYHDISYFSLLSRNMYSMLQLMKNTNFVDNFKQDEKRRADLFPKYCHILLHSFEIAEKRLEMLLEEKKPLQCALEHFLPNHIIEKIAYYFCYKKLAHCRHDYYMSLHATSKKNIADKVKIL